MTIPLWAPVLLPIMFGALIYSLPEKLKKPLSLAGTITQLAVCILIFLKSCEAPVSLSIGGWNPPVGIMLYADRFSAVLVLLTAFLFFILTVFELSDNLNKTFYMLFLILEGLLSALFLLDDLFSIFVIIEVSTIIVALLIMFKRDSRSMYDGLIYLMINIFSASFFLFGLAILYKQTGTFSLALLRNILRDVANAKPLFLPYSFILTSVCLKAALMPLFSWLPKAHGTPSSPSVVSAVLSGLYVKSGIYLFIRCRDAFSVIDTQSFFLVAGIITAIIGFVFAIAQSDVKLILSYHTISQLGLIMAAVNMGDNISLWGGIYHIINHAIFKTTLFIGIGEISRFYGTRDVYKISGAARRMPLISVSMIAAILGITGAPLFNGSISKYLISHGLTTSWSEVILLIINTGTIVSFIKFSRIFFGPADCKAAVSLNRNVICSVLGVMCLLLGILGAPIIKALFGVTVQIDLSGYVLKCIVYFACVGIAWLVYRYVVKDKAFWDRIRKFDLGFNVAAISVLAFFVVLMVYLFVSKI